MMTSRPIGAPITYAPTVLGAPAYRLWLGMGGLQLLHNVAFLHTLRQLLIAGLLLHPSPVARADGVDSAAADADPEFTIFDGYIAGDDDIKSEHTTLTQAKEICLENPECKGFTFMGGPSEGPMWINFKKKWNVGGTGWTSYRREELPFTMFDGYIAGDGDIGSEYTTLRKAKVRCLQTPDCKGFTFMGGPSEGPMWINFKKEWNVGGTGWTSYRRESRESPPTSAASEESTPAAQKEAPLPDPPLQEPDPSDATPGPSGSSQAQSNDHLEKPTDLADVASKPGTNPEPPTNLADIADAPVQQSLPKSNTSLESSPPSLEASSMSSRPDAGTLASEPASCTTGSTCNGAAPSDTAELPPPALEPASVLAKNVSHAELKVNATKDVLREDPKTVELSPYQASLFVGELMKMTKRKLVALNMENVVMCYAQPEVGGACRAALANATKEKERRENASSSDMSAGDARFLPPLTWGSHEVFLEGKTGNIESVRLNSNRFAVCFERVSDSAITCSLGFVLGGAGSGLRCAYGNSLQLGFGRLISVAPASAGRQLVACHAPLRFGEKSNVTCRWADVLEKMGSEASVELRWAASEPRTVQTVL